jgi:ankyrin repeat protein
VLALLLHSGASPDTPTNDGTSPLSAAARWGHAAAVGLLLKAGADVDSVNEVS